MGQSDGDMLIAINTIIITSSIINIFIITIITGKLLRILT